MLRVACIALGVSVSGAPSLAASGEFCVTNEAESGFLFAVDVDQGRRELDTLATRETLCVGGAGMGTVSVFENAHELEGCSVRVKAGEAISLLSFPGVDLCSWSRD